MKISIVTACYNAEEHIETALKSVICQNYPSLEYIVIDGNSTDDTYKLVQQYSSDISYHVSEPDNGQYDAIQKGFDQSSGEIMAWLNADDIYMPWTFSIVAEVFESFPEVQWITGLPGSMNERGQYTTIYASPAAYLRRYIRNGWYREKFAGYLQQESMFWRRSLWEKTTGLDTSLDLAADFKLWTDFAKHAELVQIATPLAAFRKRPGIQRSSLYADGYRDEVAQACENFPKPPSIWNKLSAQGIVARSLCRIAQLRNTNLVVYSDYTQSWHKISAIRPISRTGLWQLAIKLKLKNKTQA